MVGDMFCPCYVGRSPALTWPVLPVTHPLCGLPACGSVALTEDLSTYPAVLEGLASSVFKFCHDRRDP